MGGMVKRFDFFAVLLNTGSLSGMVMHGGRGFFLPSRA